MQDSIYGVAGRILTVHHIDKGKLTAKVNFTVFSNQGPIPRGVEPGIPQPRTLNCRYVGDLPMRVGDFIFFKARSENNLFHLLGFPLVEIDDSHENLSNALSDVLELIKISKKSVSNRIRKKLLSIAGDGAMVFLRDLSRDVTKYQSATSIGSKATPLSELGFGEEETDFILFLEKELGAKRVRWFLEKWYQERGYRRLYLLGCTRDEIEQCVGNWTPDLESMLQQIVVNPYPLLPIGLVKCREILHRLDKLTLDDSDQRCNDRCGQLAREMFRRLVNSHSTATPERMLQEDHPEFAELKSRLFEVFGFDQIDDLIYLSYPLKVEREIIDAVMKRIERARSCQKEGIANDIEESEGVTRLTPEQAKALNETLEAPISIIHGEAGTGKTTLIAALVDRLTKRGKKVQILSFTGKAVARVKEVTSHRAVSTIHRFIQRIDPTIKVDVIIIDETSMVSSPLFHEMITALDEHCQTNLVFVGDPGQLRPTEWGYLFGGLLSSEVIPTFALTRNLRLEKQETYNLYENAHLIRQRVYPFQPLTGESFFMAYGGMDSVQGLVQQFYHGGLGIDSFTILTPYNRERLILNQICQGIYDEGQSSVVDGLGRRFKIGDKVIMIKNNYDVDLMNGEEGRVMNVNVERESPLSDSKRSERPSGGVMGIKVAFKRRQCFFRLASSYERIKVENTGFTPRGLRSLKLEDRRDDISTAFLETSYCLTIDKSQGSEWVAVILYIPNHKDNEFFLDSPRIYTALTRARQKFYLIGDLDAFVRGAMRAPRGCLDPLGEHLRQCITPN